LGTYATNADVQARLPWVTFGVSTKPSTTQIDSWITEAEGVLTAALKAAQVSTPVTDANGIQLCKSIVLDFAEGRTRIALSSGVESDTGQVGVQMIKDFRELIEKIAAGPGASMWGAMMSGGNLGSSNCAVRGHVIDNADGETISDGDFDPVFEKDEVW